MINLTSHQRNGDIVQQLVLAQPEYTLISSPRQPRVYKTTYHLLVPLFHEHTKPPPLPRRQNIVARLHITHTLHKQSDHRLRCTIPIAHLVSYNLISNLRTKCEIARYISHHAKLEIPVRSTFPGNLRRRNSLHTKASPGAPGKHHEVFI